MKLLISSALFATALTASAVTLVNAGFEGPDVPLGTTDLDPDSWIVNEPAASFQVALYDSFSHEGGQSLIFNADDTPAGASVHQVFSTLLGASYEVSFWTTADLPASSSVRGEIFAGAGLGGASLSAMTSNPAGSSFTFTETLFSFVATSTTSTIAFIDNSPATAGSDLFLDDVIITQTPAPEPTAGILTGLGGLALLLRRRR